jgi:hypothetical protein
MDPAHVLAARASESASLGLSWRQLDALGTAVHYGLGIVPAALYGALRRGVPFLDAGRGGLFGLGLFLAEDEILNTASGLAGRPRDYPWQAHARGLLAHLVYGFVTDALCRASDSLLARKPAAPGTPVRYTPNVERIEPG